MRHVPESLDLVAVHVASIKTVFTSDCCLFNLLVSTLAA